MSTPFVDRSDSSHAQSAYNHMTQEAAQLVIEILRLIELNAESRSPVFQGILLDKEPQTSPISSIPIEGEIMDATVIEFLPLPPKYHLTPGEGDDLMMSPSPSPPPLIPGQMAEQLIAGTIDRLTHQYGAEEGYQTEIYRIEKEADRTRVLDPRQREILSFEKIGIDDYDILNNRMSSDQTTEFLKVRMNLEDQGLDKITTNFKTQTESLGNLAPEGTESAFVADYLLQGHETDNAQFHTYQFNRDADGNITITRNGIGRILNQSLSPDTPATHDLTQNPSGHIVIRTSEGAIVEANLTAKDNHGFSQVGRYAKEHPIGMERGEVRSTSLDFSRM